MAKITTAFKMAEPKEDWARQWFWRHGAGLGLLYCPLRKAIKLQSTPVPHIQDPLIFLKGRKTRQKSHITQKLNSWPCVVGVSIRISSPQSFVQTTKKTSGKKFALADLQFGYVDVLIDINATEGRPYSLTHLVYPSDLDFKQRPLKVLYCSDDVIIPWHDCFQVCGGGSQQVDVGCP